MFHVELRQFPHVARAFNLTREELDVRFARPWASGAVIAYDDRRWAPERARLTVYEGPQLRTSEIGMGRGWSTVAKTARDDGRRRSFSAMCHDLRHRRMIFGEPVGRAIEVDDLRARESQFRTIDVQQDLIVGRRPWWRGR